LIQENVHTTLTCILDSENTQMWSR